LIDCLIVCIILYEIQKQNTKISFHAMTQLAADRKHILNNSEVQKSLLG